jgi:hypothetical protein
MSEAPSRPYGTRYIDLYIYIFDRHGCLWVKLIKLCDFRPVHQFHLTDYMQKCENTERIKPPGNQERLVRTNKLIKKKKNFYLWSLLGEGVGGGDSGD